MYSAPRQDLGVCCERKVHYPTFPGKDSFVGPVSRNLLCRYCAEVLSWFLWAFCSCVGGSHAFGSWLKETEQLWMPCVPKWSSLKGESKQRITWQLNILFYFHSLSWSEDWWKRKITMWDKVLLYKVYSMFSGLELTALQLLLLQGLGFSWLPAEHKHQWFVWMGKFAGLALAERAVWQGQLQSASHGGHCLLAQEHLESSAGPSVCPQPHCLIIFVDCL